MVLAANAVIEMGGGNAVVEDGEVKATMPLPIGGLMSDKDARTVAEENRRVRLAAEELYKLRRHDKEAACGYQEKNQ